MTAPGHTLGPWRVSETMTTGAVLIKSCDYPPQLIAEVIESDGYADLLGQAIAAATGEQP